jgi:hypothetical protein
MTTHEERKQVIVLLNESITAGARRAKACEVLGLSERTLQRWQTGEAVRCDQRPLRDYQPPHKLTAIERAEVLAVANSDEFGHLPPSQIVPRLADQGRYLASESTFYRILRERKQLAHRRSERPAQTRTKPRAICAQPLTSSIAGTLLTCHHLSEDSFSISIYLLIFSAGRSSVGRSMKKKIAPWLANCYATYVIVKVYSQNSLFCILTTAVP